MNIFVFMYFMIHRGLVTDFSEPPNLFALAVNSPPSHVLAGSCGGGPEGEQYMVNWFVNHEGSHLFMEPSEKAHLLGGHGHAHDHAHGPVREVVPSEATANRYMTSVTGAFKRGLGIKGRQAPTKIRSATAVESLRSSGARPTSVAASNYELEEGNTRTQRQYEKLANRRSML